MQHPWDDPSSPEGRRWHEERQQFWSGMWDYFRPADGVHRVPLFYIDIPTIILSGLVGFPLGQAVAVALTGQPALGGIVGFLVMMLVFGFFRRRLQRRRVGPGREAALPHTVARSPLRAVIGGTAIGALVMAIVGVWFAFSEGDIDPVTAAVRFGAVGAVPGFLVGLVAAWRRQRHRRMLRKAD